MVFFRKLAGYLPRPFKYIQRQLNIQFEWQQFKTNMRPHRYKLYFLLLVGLYPVYNPYFEKYFLQAKSYLTAKTHESLQPDQPTFQIGENLAKNLIASILNDQNIKNEGLNFVHHIINDQKFLQQILQLLLTASQNKQFLNAVGDTSKNLILSQLKDPEIEEELNNFIQKIASSKQTKQAFIKLIQEAFSSKESVDTIVELLKRGINENKSGITARQVKQSVSETVNYSVKQLLGDEETINQLRVFIFFLLRKFQNDDEIKGIMDILFAKGVGMFKKQKKHPELDKILKISRQKPTDYL